MLVIRQRIDARPEWQAELELTYDARSKSRLRCFSTSGEDVGLFLERGQPPLHDGECLLAGDGRVGGGGRPTPHAPNNCCTSPAPVPSS